MKSIRLIIIILLCCVLSGAPGYSKDGLLGDIREEVEEEDKKNVKKKKHKEKKHKSSHSNVSVVETIEAVGDFVEFVKITGMIITSPFWGPYEMLDGRLQAPGSFALYPYHDGFDGYMMQARTVDGTCQENAMRMSVEYGYDFEGVHNVSFNGLLSTSGRFALDFTVTEMVEYLDDASYDKLMLGDVNFLFRFVQNPKVQMRTGVGLRFMKDSGETWNGGNFIYEADFYPQDPIVISASIQIGSINHADVSQGRFTIGAVQNGYELYGGYDSMKIGDVQIHGPVLGLRAWF